MTFIIHFSQITIQSYKSTCPTIGELSRLYLRWRYYFAWLNGRLREINDGNYKIMFLYVEVYLYIYGICVWVCLKKQYIFCSIFWKNLIPFVHSITGIVLMSFISCRDNYILALLLQWLIKSPNLCGDDPSVELNTDGMYFKMQMQK